MEITLPSRPKKTASSGLSQLCGACSQLQLASLLAAETKQSDIGPVSNYSSPDCPFCNLISKAIHLGWETPPNLFIQSRSPLSTKINGHIHHPQPRLLLAVDKKPPGFHESQRVIRQIDRVKNRFIVAEIESLPQKDAAEPAYIVRRDVKSGIDADLVKSWLQECQRHKHSVDDKKLRTESKKVLFSNGGFRLIDVQDECLVLQTDENCDFVALSYVWGRLSTILRRNKEKPEEIPILLTTDGNLGKLSVPKGLSSGHVAGTRIAQTVQDAMDFTRALGQRYLWVDTLCIIQDNKPEKTRLMGLMDDVYNNAVATLIAADGNDADAGLRGWGTRTPARRGRPIEPSTIIDDGQTLTISLCPPSLVEEIRRSKWNTRGWTFQEQQLSRRCVYFTTEEVFFTCVDGQRRESYRMPPLESKVELRTGPPWWAANLRKDPNPTPYHYLGNPATLNVQDYQAAVHEYSRMDLSYPEDALNAFAGVFNRLNQNKVLGIGQTQGIPAEWMYQALLWFPSDNGCKRRVLPPGLNVKFSTWSWAFWLGPVEFAFADSAWLSRIISLAPSKDVPLHVAIPSWSFANPDGIITTIWSRESWKPAGKEATDNSSPPSPTKAKRVGSGKLSSRVSTETYLEEGVGVDAAVLRAHQAPETLVAGELGFFAPYLAAENVVLKKAPKKERFLVMEVASGQNGEFRFDDENEDEMRQVDEFLLVLAAETVQDAALQKTYSVFLGVVTSEDGSSKRVGLGFVYYPADENVEKPSWGYKQFRLG
ncbi:heterokaryon incompatibility protein-domain-containing protein [Schizothecium vesticola]|uniref:Heterokaryon incompatibility protein-domain-containing protein n=1 Tax=Schizothecium vesticola TaxID=314040 RepID=A0AA40F3R5_9PEZI|nr:heterokaryon incompatibility protein-domain-containing protein [Schizothecium vesticola]